MANKYMNTEFLDKAIMFAVKAHANTERRGKAYPYIIHPMEAMEIVASMTNDEDLLVAAALHDVVEDTDVTIKEIEENFGKRVALLVDAESDLVVKGKNDRESWRERKQTAINRLENTSRDAKMVALGDKLSNMRAIYRDYMTKGDELWKIFHAPNGKQDHEWHYRELARVLNDLEGTFAFTEFTSLVTKVFGEEKPTLLNMEDWEESGDGFTSISYNHKNGKRMMKLYSNFIPKHVSEEELKMSRNITNLGLNIPKAYRMVTDGKRYGVEFERITPKKSFARAISDEPQKLEYYAREFAHEVKMLHSTPCNTTALPSIKIKFHNIVDEATFLSNEEKVKIHTYIDNVQDAMTCCHGDLHIGNIIKSNDKNYWIDLSDFAWGNEKFDLGMFWFVSHYDDENLCQRLYHISCAQMSKIWNIFIEEYYGVKTEEEIDKISESIKPFASFYFILFANRKCDEPFMKGFVKEQLCK